MSSTDQDVGVIKNWFELFCIKHGIKHEEPPPDDRVNSPNYTQTVNDKVIRIYPITGRYKEIPSGEILLFTAKYVYDKKSIKFTDQLTFIRALEDMMCFIDETFLPKLLLANQKQDMWSCIHTLTRITERLAHP